MKKLLFALVMLVAVGAGCVQLPKFGGKDKEVTGDWHLAFDLPSGWIVAEPYSEPNTSVVVPSTEVDRTMTEVYLQNTSKAIVNSGATVDEAVAADTYVADDYQQIRVTRLDTRRVIPSEAEDIGDGFFKISDTEYYLKTATANYKFDVRASDTDELGQAERVILSAEEVTVLEAQTETE